MVKELLDAADLDTADTALAYDGAGTLYFLPNGLLGNLYTLNTSTGVATSLVTLDGGYFNGASGGATVHDGTLYSLDCPNSSDGRCDLSTIDPSTGETRYGSFGLPGGLDAIASPTP